MGIARVFVVEFGPGVRALVLDRIVYSLYFVVEKDSRVHVRNEQRKNPPHMSKTGSDQKLVVCEEEQMSVGEKAAKQAAPPLSWPFEQGPSAPLLPPM